MNNSSSFSYFTSYINNQQARIAHWDGVAESLNKWHGLGDYYHRRLEDIYTYLIIPGQSVIEIGCARGDLLAAVKPNKAVGVDFSCKMLQLAKERHPQYQYIQCDAHEIDLAESYDVIILSDLINDLWDVQTVFENVAKLCHSRTRIILNFYSKFWEPPLSLARRLRLANPNLEQNWLSPDDLIGILNLADFQVIKNWQEVLCPVTIPFLDVFANKYLVKFKPFSFFALANFMVARPSLRNASPNAEPLVSVVVPARNESGNIPEIFKRVPELGRGTELIFVEGHSEDDTYASIQAAIRDCPEKLCRLIKQTGVGKGDAVRLGFSFASGDMLMILDADLTVPPEDLSRFYNALISGKGEFINGVRMVYPMQKQAMRFLNILGNKLFSLAFSWLLNSPIKDTLCGTKALWKKDYELISLNRSYFGNFDPFGDFDLLFGASRLGLKIIDLPIRYRDRNYGKTNIHRWKHGWLLLRMLIFALGRMKFI